jgi:hypothetical protein
MPFAFIIAGLLLLVSGARGKSQNLVTLIKNDFSGQNNYVYWMLSIFVLGGLGYIQDFRAISRSFLILVVVVLIINEDQNGNSFFTQFQAAITNIGSSSNSVDTGTAKLASQLE